MNKRKIVIDLIMTNTCNRRCDYCPINFDGRILSNENIDFLINYLEKNKNTYDECTLNFFGGEPLLNFENIKYFIDNNYNNKINYTLGTNGMLLTEDILDYLILNNVKIYLTFHADNDKTYKELIKKDYLKKGLELIQINFIVSPINLDLSYIKIDKTVKFGFKVINIIPVMLTIEWDKLSMIKLKKFISYVDVNYIDNKNNSDIEIYKFSYFDGIPVEVGFVIDTDLSLYQDSSDELFIGRQFDGLGKELIKKVEEFTLLGNIKNNDLDFFIGNYDIKNIVKMLYSLPKKLGYLKDYAIIYKIMNSNKNQRSNMGGNIYDILTSKIK